jgi:hypothetical protein
MEATTDGGFQPPSKLLAWGLLAGRWDALGREEQPGYHRVCPMIQQGRARFVPAHEQGLHVCVRVPVTQVAHRGSDEEARGIPDGDAAGLGGGVGAYRGLGGGAQQCLGERQEDFAGLGELCAPRCAVEQAGAQLLFKVSDLPAQGRLGDSELGGGPADMRRCKRSLT